MRGKRSGHERTVLDTVPECETFVYMVLFALCPGISKLKHRHTNLRAKIHLCQGSASSFRKEVGIGGAGGAAHNHLHGSQAGAVVDKLLTNQFAFNGPDPVGQPIHHFSVVCDATQQGHGGVPVHVDEAGCHQVPFKFQVRGVGKSDQSFCLWQQGANSGSFYHQAVIEQ